MPRPSRPRTPALGPRPQRLLLRLRLAKLLPGLSPALPPLLVSALVSAQLSLLPPLRAQEVVDDFGRWEREVRRCQVGMAPGGVPGGVLAPGRLPASGRGLTPAPDASLACETVRLDQQLPGLLSVRFFSRGQGPGPSKRLLMFAGILERGSSAMACRAGSCRWASPMRLRVSALAELGLTKLAISKLANSELDLSDLGGTTSLPTTRLVQGSCHIQPQRIRCQAHQEGEGAWWAEADL